MVCSARPQAFRPKFEIKTVKDLTLYFEILSVTKRVAAVCAVSLTLVLSSAQGATLTSVPMQGGMVMPIVSYHASDGMLHVMMPSTVPQLTPLLVSNPGDSFDPADPWFDALDPSRRGLSFSRRYGFVMDAMTDTLPAGYQIWIRKLSGSVGLSAYRYRDSAPKMLDPIFGTDGVTNALYWNGMMFHPVFAAPPGTNGYSASLEVFLLDTATGLEVPNSTSGPLLFTWTDVPDGRPALSIAPGIVLSWPSGTTTNWLLETAGSPTAQRWTVVTNAPVLVNGQSCVSRDGSAGQEFFRMRYVP